MAPTVLLLHGFTHTGSSWELVVAALGERYRSLAPDLRGHGTASEARPVTLEAVLEDLEPPSRAHGITLVGYSMGGRIALHCALAWPGRVRRLVLIGASPGIASAAERERRQAERLADEIEEESIEAFAARWAQTPVLAGLPPDVLARAHADRLRNHPAGLARALRALGTGALPSLWERLGELMMPVTLVVGERDEKFREIAMQMRGAIPAAELHLAPDRGHAVHLEAPARVAEIIAHGG
jgi:2-succinyl-6-hydroxy-2,4-cyclohexadiene-1-carboxylate synthase